MKSTDSDDAPAPVEGGPVDWEAKYKQSLETIVLLEQQLKAVRQMWYWPLAAPARRLWRARFRRQV